MTLRTIVMHAKTIIAATNGRLSSAAPLAATVSEINEKLI